MRNLQDLLDPYLEQPLDGLQLRQVELYLNLLLKWNAKMNLTSIRDAEEIVRRHFGESLFAAGQLALAESSSLMDLGSGAGFPGVPIKLVAPQLEVTLIESQQKKATFLREVIRALNLQKTTVLCGRAEESKLKAQIVTMRAVEKFEFALVTSAGLLQSGGQLALLVGAAQADSAGRQLPSFTWKDPVAIPESRTRVLLIGTNG